MNGEPAVAPEVEVLVVAEIRGRQVQRRAREQGLEGDPAFQAPELRADAVVVTVAEREMVDRRPPHVEAIGVGEVARVPVGRGQHRHHELAAADRLAGAGDVLGGHPADELHGAVVAEELLDGVPDEPRLAPEPLQLIRMPQERGEAVAEQVGGDLVAGVEQEQRVREQLVEGQPDALLLDLDERAEQALAGRPPQLVDLVREIRAELQRAVEPPSSCSSEMAA